MKIIKIKSYDELEGLIKENEFIVDISDASLKLKTRIIDFLAGLTLINGSLKKVSVDTFEVIINKNKEGNYVR